MNEETGQSDNRQGCWPRFLTHLSGPPAPASPDETRKAERLHTILLALIIMVLVLTPFYLLVLPREIGINLLIIAGSASVFGADLWLLHRGHFRLARRIFAAFFYVVIIAIAIAFDGVYDTALTAFFLLAGILGLINGGRAAFLTAVLGSFGLIFVYLVDYWYGGIGPPLQPPLVKVIEMSALLLVLGLVLRMTLADLNAALERARQEVAERKVVEAQLVEARDRLEERVEERTLALSRANRNLNTLIETSQNGVIFMTNQGKIAVINSRALELLGIPGDATAWEGRDPEELLRTFIAETAVDREEIEQQLAKVFENPAARAQGEMALPQRFIHWYYAPTTVGEETPAQLVILRDVTAQRQAEQMRNDLISTMVHDLRNPLAGILSLLSTLTWMDAEGKEVLSGRQRRYVERGMETVRQMSQLISNILDVSRLESGQMPVQQEAVPLREAILKTVEAQKSLASEKQLSLVTEIPAALPPAQADPALLERILQNLLDNAIKFTPTGGEVRVLARMGSSAIGEEDEIEIAVADTGPGIPSALQAALFQKFVAGDGEGSGSGLGLAFCKLAVEAHGGQIFVKSEVDVGTVFTFTLPAA